MFKLILLVIFSFVALSGCASNKLSCRHDHKIGTAKTDTGLVRIPYVDVKHESDSLIVYGVIERHNVSSHHSLTAHVDISVFDEQNNLLKQARTDKIYISEKRLGKTRSFTRFKLNIPMEVQQNITVHAQGHRENSCPLQKT